MTVLSNIAPAAADSLYFQAMNKRLGVVGDSVEQLATIAAEKKLTMDQIVAIKEVDGWEYSDGVSYVCSAYVAALYKAAGLFDDLDI